MKKWINEHPGMVISLAAGVFLVAVTVAFLTQGMHQVDLYPRWELPEADPDRGRAAIVAHGCGACHVIPGIRNANARVGPRLIGIHEQSYIAGVLPHTPENLIRWIHDPQEVNPLTAMPTLGVTEQDARDIAAYLYTIRD